MQLDLDRDAVAACADQLEIDDPERAARVAVRLVAELRNAEELIGPTGAAEDL